MELGWSHDTSEGAPVCRWKKNSLIVDIMPTKGEILGFSNIWYTAGFKNAETKELPTGQKVMVFSFPYFVASKLEALKDRGLKNLLESQDFEDLLFVIEGRKTFFTELAAAPAEIIEHAKQVLGLLIKHPSFEHAARGNIPRGLTRERESLLIRQIIRFAGV